MQESCVRIGGATVFYDLGVSNYESLLSALTPYGLERYMPDRKTPAACLKVALNEVMKGQAPKGKKVVIRPQEDRENSFAVGWIPSKVREDDNEESFEHQFFGHLVGGTESSDIRCSPYQEFVDALRNPFDCALHSVSKASLSSAIVDIIENVLHGISLRDSGGFYWIPESQISAWKCLASAIETTVTKGGTHTFHCISAVADDAMVAAVCDAVESETISRLSTLEKSVAKSSDSFSVQNCQAKWELCEKCRQRVASFETLLSRPMSALHDAITQTERMCALTALQTTGAQMAETDTLAAA